MGRLQESTREIVVVQLNHRVCHDEENRLLLCAPFDAGVLKAQRVSEEEMGGHKGQEASWEDLPIVQHRPLNAHTGYRFRSSGELRLMPHQALYGLMGCPKQKYWYGRLTANEQWSELGGQDLRGL